MRGREGALGRFSLRPENQSTVKVHVPQPYQFTKEPSPHFKLIIPRDNILFGSRFASKISCRGSMDGWASSFEELWMRTACA